MWSYPDPVLWGEYVDSVFFQVSDPGQPHSDPQPQWVCTMEAAINVIIINLCISILIYFLYVQEVVIHFIY